ncbi:prolipoprotein diacylglyceryl transferase [Herpetosiphon sp. NSE202]|uniref:prolipoprotein diacylglyceryl transferase n=1 Tax=Herpetosiphon sp. NSE202 TaxID=3351349 RepID=UPI00363A10B8
MQPPFGPNLLELGPIIIRMYAIAILSGAMMGGWLGAHRARARGYNPNIVWDWLIVGLILGVAGGRIWYVASSWPQYRDGPFIDMINTTKGGLAIHGAIVGAVLTVIIASWRTKTNALTWMDIMAPCLSVGQAIGRWGNFFNNEAYGGPVNNGLPWNLNIPAQYRIRGTEQYDAATRFHPTFLYESFWNLGVLFAIVFIERRFRGRLRNGDSLLIYGVLYSIGRFWIEDLRVDKLCTGGVGGAACGDSLSTARLTSIVLIVGCSSLFVLRRALQRRPPASSYQQWDNPWQPEPSEPAKAAA